MASDPDSTKVYHFFNNSCMPYPHHWHETYDKRVDAFDVANPHGPTGFHESLHSRETLTFRTVGTASSQYASLSNIVTSKVQIRHVDLSFKLPPWIS